VVISARVEAVKLAVLAKHFEQLGVRIRSKSQLLNLIIDKATSLLTEKGAYLDILTPAQAVEVFVRLGFEAPTLTRAEAEEQEAVEVTESISDYITEAVERVKDTTTAFRFPPS
jgi:hypothetical protein